MALDLAVCGGLLAGLSSLAQYLQPDFPALTLITGVLGGGLCVLWSVLGRRGARWRGGAMATLAVVACVLTAHAVQCWTSSAERKPPNGTVLLLMFVLVVFCVGLLANLVREGKGSQP